MPLPTINDTQYLDERCGLIFPWFSKPFLDQMMHWRWEDKRVFQYGGGWSDIWFSRYVKELYSVECDLQWVRAITDEVNQRGGKIMGRLALHSTEAYYQYEGANFAGNLLYREVIPGEVELKSKYVNAIYEIDGEFDCIIIDGSYRDETIAAALTKIKDGGIIICDNWDQEGVWDSIMGSRLLDPWPMHAFVEPSRAQDLRPWKTCYWQIYKNMQCTWGEDYYWPNILSVDNEYESHKPMLWMALEHIKPGLVVEFGCGMGSTPVLHRYCSLQDRPFLSLETNAGYADKFPGITTHLGDYKWANERRLKFAGADGVLRGREPVKVLFIDSAPGEERAQLLLSWANEATVLIVHDTEPGAEYVYHIQDALNSFKYRCDLIIGGRPQTTAVSNVYNFERWKGVTLGEFTFV